MSVHARELLCVCLHAWTPVRVCAWLCEPRWRGYRGCVHMHPPSPQAVLCIVVGMAYLLTQAWFCVVQYTRLPIYAALQSHVRRPASFTFAPELMLVNCHINSDLLACSVHSVNRARCAIAGLVLLWWTTHAWMDWQGLSGLPKAAAIHTNAEQMKSCIRVLRLKATLCCVHSRQKRCRLCLESPEVAAVQVFHSRAKQWVWRLGWLLLGSWLCTRLCMFTCVEPIFACQEWVC